MFGAFTVMRQLHELLWHVSAALTLRPARSIHGALSRALAETERCTRLDADALLKVDVAAHRHSVNTLLVRASELTRAQTGWRQADLRGADLLGKDLSDADLAAANLRGACLIGANLTGADLRAADLTGADLRGADLTGADLTGAIFLTQAQVDAAKGNAGTRLPPPLISPSHWPPPATSVPTAPPTP